jgi:hypothetical protein
MNISSDGDTGALIVHITNDHLSISNHFFYGMPCITLSPYRFQLPLTMLLETIKFLEDFENLLSWPVMVYGTLRVYRAEPTEMNFRGHLSESLHETQFRWWKTEKQQEQRVAMTNYIAAKLQLEYASLDFGYCQDLASQVMAFTLEERAVTRSAKFSLLAADQCWEIFKGEVDMETEDASGFGVRLAQSDLLRFRSNLAASVKSASPVQLIAE